MVSTTITFCDDIAMFPDESETIQVTIVSPSGKFCGASFDNDWIFTSSNTSGSINSTSFSFILLASIIISSGISTLGDVESINVTCCCIVEIFLITSVTVQLTIVSPSEKTSGASFSILITPTASETDGVSSCTRFCVTDFASSIISGNISTSGGVVSWITTCWDSIAIFPDPSIAVQITVVIPSGKDSAALFDSERIPLSSSAVAWPISTDVNPPVASIIISSGTIMTGFVKSFGIGVTGGSSISGSITSDSVIVSGCSISGSWIISSFSIINFSVTRGVENFWILWLSVSVT